MIIDLLDRKTNFHSQFQLTPHFFNRTVWFILSEDAKTGHSGVFNSQLQCVSLAVWNIIARLKNRFLDQLVLSWYRRALFLKAAKLTSLYNTMSTTARSRVYSDVNVHRPREYWDYESHVIEWG